MAENKEIIDMMLYLVAIGVSIILFALLCIRYRQEKIWKKAKQRQQERLMKMKSDLHKIEQMQMEESH